LLLECKKGNVSKNNWQFSIGNCVQIYFNFAPAFAGSIGVCNANIFRKQKREAHRRPLTFFSSPVFVQVIWLLRCHLVPEIRRGIRIYQLALLDLFA